MCVGAIVAVVATYLGMSRTITITADIRHKDKASPSRTCKVVSFFFFYPCFPFPSKSAHIGKSAQAVYN